MAEGRGLKPVPLDVASPKWESFDPAQFVLDYDKKTDILYARPAQPRAATSIDVDEEIWLRMDPITGEIVGFEIDDFQLVFLKKHPEIAAAWYEESTKRQARDRVTLVLTILVELLRRIAGSHPQQPRLQYGAT